MVINFIIADAVHSRRIASHTRSLLVVPAFTLVMLTLFDTRAVCWPASSSSSCLRQVSFDRSESLMLYSAAIVTMSFVWLLIQRVGWITEMIFPVASFGIENNYELSSLSRYGLTDGEMRLLQRRNGGNFPALLFTQLAEEVDETITHARRPASTTKRLEMLRRKALVLYNSLASSKHKK